MAKHSPSWLRYLHCTLHIDISSTSITLVHSSGFFSRSKSVLDTVALDCGEINEPERWLARLDDSISKIEMPYRGVSIVLDDVLARMWMVTPPGNAGSHADCEAATCARFQTLFVEPISDFEIEADWDARRPFLACALPRSLLHGLHEVCAKHHLLVRRIQPHFVMTWNSFRRDLQSDAWLAVLEPERITLGLISQGRLLAVRRNDAHYDIYQSRDWLHQVLAREAMLFDLPVPQKLLIKGKLPAQWQKNDGAVVQCLSLGSLDMSHVPSTALHGQVELS